MGLNGILERDASAIFHKLVGARSSSLGSTKTAFAHSRFAEGERTVELVGRLFPHLFAGRPTIVDLGSGNGGMLLPFTPLGRCIALDTYVDPDLREVLRSTRLRAHQTRTVAQALPLASASVDLVILAEVIEHLSQPKLAGAEIMRVLKPGGVCLLSTPPRFVFAARPDPHFQIRFLVLLPDALQRALARVLRPREPYNVAHVYATTWGIARQFPRGTFRLHVVSHRLNWTKHISWNYLALQRLAA